MYKQPDIESSYRENDLGRTLYIATMMLKPMNVIEIGTYLGYSAVCIAQALRDLGGKRHLTCYDIWDEYEYRHCGNADTLKNINKYGLTEYITLEKMHFSEVVKHLYGKCRNRWDIGMIHVDVSNNGDTIKKLYEANLDCENIFFEGGSKERDQVDWMAKYNKTPIRGSCSYTIIDERFPSISLMSRKKGK